MEETVQPHASVVPEPTTSTAPVPKPHRYLGLIIILVVLVLAISAFLYITFKPSATTSLQGSTTAGTDNQSLDKDLNNVNSGISQGDQDLSSGASSLSDQQPTITAN